MKRTAQTITNPNIHLILSHITIIRQRKIYFIFPSNPTTRRRGGVALSTTEQCGCDGKTADKETHNIQGQFVIHFQTLFQRFDTFSLCCVSMDRSRRRVGEKIIKKEVEGGQTSCNST